MALAFVLVSVNTMLRSGQIALAIPLVLAVAAASVASLVLAICAEPADVQARPRGYWLVVAGLGIGCALSVYLIALADGLSELAENLLMFGAPLVIGAFHGVRLVRALRAE